MPTPAAALPSRCALCGAGLRLTTRGQPGYIEGRVYDIYCCTACQTRNASPLESDEKVYDAIYRNPTRLPGYERYARYADEVLSQPDPLEFLASREDMYWAVQRCLAMAARGTTRLRVLEVGSGLGYLTHAIVRAGYDIVGLDISSAAVARARERYGDHFVCSAVEDYATRQPGGFDVVIITEVVEHLTDPVSVMQSVATLVAPGGRILLTTPNRSYYRGRRVWGSDLPPVHLWWFSAKSMRALASRLGARVEFISFRKFDYSHPQNPLERWFDESFRGESLLDRDGTPRPSAASMPRSRSWFAAHVPWPVTKLCTAGLNLIFNPRARRQTLAAVFVADHASPKPNP